jgi:hypothetical protein
MKHAIFIRGSLRTWNFVKKDIIEFHNSAWGMPDWYICFWKSNTRAPEQLKEDFNGCNVKMLHIENEDTYKKFNAMSVMNDRNGATVFSQNAVNYWRLAYLDHIMSTAKRRYEIDHKIEYKTVTFIRPDIIYRTTVNIKPQDFAKKLDELGNMDILNQNYGNKSEWQHIASRTENYFVNDFNWIAGKLAADIYGTRFFDPHHTDTIIPQFMNWDPHQNMGYIQSRNQLFYGYTGNVVTGKIIRPNDIIFKEGSNEFEIPKISDEDAGHTKSVPKQRRTTEWLSLPTEMKIQLCDRADIDIADYSLTRPKTIPKSGI